MSRGNVHVTGVDPDLPPAIDPCFLNSDFDTIILLELLKFVIELGRTSSLSDIIAQRTEPGPRVASDNALISYIRSNAAGGSHLIGTAALAPRKFGGVDSSLKVYGTSNLRIVDASIIPNHIVSHTQSSVYAISELTADMITRSA
ncbi:hypothetical protein HGRIS_001110 [Hohenbuehelia grisea]|uniref:Glucose-methanol-choline oxidoreductase C-terminal domain-containing protein n=1 Tax=Hohenbuehelia grisea TaxID=104357 RepID=A0ABR3JPK0_9AGAR